MYSMVKRRANEAMRSRVSRAALICCFFLVLGAALAAGPLGAETVMIAVRETVDGTPSPPPLPAVEGVSSALFEAGHIVFDSGASGGSAKSAELRNVAQEGGAGWILQVTVAYTETKVDQGVMRVTGSASFDLVNASTGATAASDRISASNEGREKIIDRTALGRELGKLISQRVVKALPAPSL